MVAISAFSTNLQVLYIFLLSLEIPTKTSIKPIKSEKSQIKLYSGKPRIGNERIT